MNSNVGGIDKRLRMVAGIALILFGVFFKSAWGLIGIVPLVTALINWCPAYTLIGFSSCPSNVKKS